MFYNHETTTLKYSQNIQKNEQNSSKQILQIYMFLLKDEGICFINSDFIPEKCDMNDKLLIHSIFFLFCYFGLALFDVDLNRKLD